MEIRVDSGADALDGGWLRLWQLVTSGLNAAGTALVFLIAAFCLADIGGRVLLNAPLAGVPELVTMAIVAIVFLQVPHAVASGTMIRADMLIVSLERRRPRAAAVFEAIYAMVGLAAFCVILVGSLPLLRSAWSEGYQYGTPGVFLFPQWPLRLVVVIGCVAVIVQFALIAVRKLLTAFKPREALAAPLPIPKGVEL